MEENKNIPMEEDVRVEAASIEEAGDFQFVRQDPSRYEQKFDTKPTTYFKDALRRFLKSKSAVAGFIILSVLVLMAIFVPILDRNAIDKPIESAKFLPPKIFDNANGFLDGTGVVKDALLDPNTGEFPATSDYKSYAVIGDITTREGYSDSFNQSFAQYAKGGSVAIINEGYNDPEFGYTTLDGGIRSPEVTINLSDETLNFTYHFDKETNVEKKYADTTLNVYVGFLYYPENGGSGESTPSAVSIPLSETVDLYDQESLQISNISGIIKSSEAFQALNYAEPTIKGHLTFFIEAPATRSDSANRAYIASASTTSSALSKAAWTDSTRMKATSVDASVEINDKYTAWSFYSQESRYNADMDVYHALVTYGTFRYDYYAAAFGDVAGKEITIADMDEYIEKGWVQSWDWEKHIDTTASKRQATTITVDPADFVLTPEGETYCPLRSIESVTFWYSSTLRQWLIRGNGTISLYRQLYQKGQIASCDYPRYIFGTDQNGKDFFKLVFSGLLTSLGLGALSSIINIAVGLIYGAIEGYFGGWTDMIMERFSEILGGMPWIVVMTLIVLLLGSNFWTFLLALCLTGWIGMAAETRSQFYRFKGREYVLASRTLGASDGRLIFRHILPNGIGTIITSAVLMIPGVIFTEANIAYLLPGALAISDTFGVTLSNVQAYLRTYPYLIVSASIIMALIMITFNLFGNGLRDAFNPSLKGADE